MTTRANAYAYAHIRNFKRIPTFPANGPPLRALPHDASLIGPLPRAVTNGNNARIGKIAASRCHVGYSAASCAGTRYFCSTARLQSIAGASLSKESTQRNDTTIPEEILQSSSAEDKDKDEPPLPKGHKPICPNLLEVEYSIFLLLVNKRISPRDIIIKRSKNQTISSCHVSFPINKTESLTITKASNTLAQARTGAFWTLFHKIRGMHGWEKIASDPRTKSALKNMSPFFKEGTADSIDMAVRQYHRFLKMYGRQNFQLEPVWSMGKTKASWSCTVSLSVPGFPTMKATGEVISGVREVKKSAEVAAHLRLIEEMERVGLLDPWDEKENSKARSAKLELAQKNIEDEKENSKARSAKLEPARKNMEDLQHRKSLEDMAKSRIEEMAAEIANLSKQNDLESSNESPAIIKKHPSDCGFAELTADDEIIEHIGSSRNELLRLSERLDKARSFLPPKPERPSRSFGALTPLPRGEKRSEELRKILKRLRESQKPEILDIRSKVADLPVSSFKESILDLVNNNPFSIIVAETGSGKSTQVPQIILDDAIDRGVGGDCNILCTQPRRLAAFRLADRVSQERSERIGQTVGYVVRHRREFSIKNTHITFCTTGILLNSLQRAFGSLHLYSHIIIDEVHVRDIGIDFVMLLLKRHIQSCREKGTRVPKVTIMSATVDTDLFASYFTTKGPDGLSKPAPYISIPGRQFHVQHHYLDEILDDIKNSSHADNMKGLLEDSETKKWLEKHFDAFGEESKKSANGDSESPSPYPTVPSPNTPAPRLSLAEEDLQTPTALYAATILNILTTTTSGSIVCFLPGLRQILLVKDHLESCGHRLEIGFDDVTKFRIGILHSQLPDEQDQLGVEIPSGCRRIILSTDIAEASVTIPDVKYVVDSGKVNQMLVDQKKHSSRLATCWTTQSNLKQRAGRVGRVQAGEYYYVGTKRRYDTLRITQTPEILQGGLQDTCLRAKLFAGKESISTFLQGIVEPPDNDEVIANVNSLKQLQALDEKENITTLGQFISQIPLAPHLGKLVILGTIFRCLDPLIILACLDGQQPLFLRTTDPASRKQVHQKRIDFAEGSASDHISTLNAFTTVRKIHREEGYFAAKRYAVDNMIWFRSYESSLRSIRSVFDQLILDQTLPFKTKEATRSDGSGKIGGQAYNMNSHHIPLIKALLLHCLSPRIAGPKPMTWLFATDYDSRTIVHPRSVVMAGRSMKQPPRSLTVYSSKVETGQREPFLLENTLVTPLMASLFGGRLTWDSKEMIMDSWLSLNINTEKSMIDKDEAARSLIEMQKAINLALNSAYNSLSFQSPNQTGTRKPLAWFALRKTLNYALAESIKGILDRDRDTGVIDQPYSPIDPDVWDDTYFSDEYFLNGRV